MAFSMIVSGATTAGVAFLSMAVNMFISFWNFSNGDFRSRSMRRFAIFFMVFLFGIVVYIVGWLMAGLPLAIPVFLVK